MAVVYVVSETQAVDWTFQPAATVSVLVSQLIITNYNTNFIYGEGDIDTLTYPFAFASPAGTATTEARLVAGQPSFKYFINNSAYISFTINAGKPVGFTGIQIQ